MSHSSNRDRGVASVGVELGAVVRYIFAVFGERYLENLQAAPLWQRYVVTALGATNLAAIVVGIFFGPLVWLVLLPVTYAIVLLAPEQRPMR